VKRRRPPPRIPNRIPPVLESEAPGLLELERFSQASLGQWSAAQRNLRELHQAFFFALEQQRQAHSAELIEALRAHASAGELFTQWSRIIDYRYSEAPLSVAGSLRRGGRFNIGADIDAATFTPFPALYIAEDYPTAFRERFGADEAATGRLSTQELALRTPASFTHVALRGQLELVIDVGASHTLAAFARVLSRFVIPSTVRALARRLAIQRPLQLVRSVSGLYRQLLHPHWRAEPTQFDLPANSQVFGRIAASAGLHGILYPSARHASGRCLALFPQNWKGSTSFIEILGGAPSQARLIRIDGTTAELE